MSGRPTPSRTSATRTSATRMSSSRTPSRPNRGGPRRGVPRSASRPAQPSELELALDAAATATAAEPAVETSFAALGLPDRLVSALARRDLHAPFAIQTRAIPDALAGRDVLGRAATGSGKTLAFGLPMLTRLVGGERLRGNPRGLVLVPTRELAQQVHDALAPLAQALDLKIMSVYGGASMGRQIDQLRRGADVVVATPGRLQDLIEQRECSLHRVVVTVLDEADHMADLGFLPAVTALLDLTDPDAQRLLFSATLDRGVDRLVRAYLKDPAFHAVASADSHVTTMDHRVYALQHDAKVDVSAEIAERPGRTLFFVRTKHGADRLATQLRTRGVPAGAIHGNLTQHARKRALEDFSSGRARVLVATDVAARGIHVDDVDLVVHYDPPADSKDYLHRSGRTARAGASGTVLSLITSDQVRDHQRMRERAGVEASAVSVLPGHPAVRELAESGTPIVVAPRPAYVPRPQGERRRPRDGAPRSRPSSDRGSSERPGAARSGRPRPASAGQGRARQS